MPRTYTVGEIKAVDLLEQTKKKPAGAETPTDINK